MHALRPRGGLPHAVAVDEQRAHDGAADLYGRGLRARAHRGARHLRQAAHGGDVGADAVAAATIASSCSPSTSTSLVGASHAYARHTYAVGISAPRPSSSAIPSPS